MLAQNFSEDPKSAANGGDLGFIPQSALDQAGPEVRSLILQLQPGQITRPMHGQDTYRIFKVMSRSLPANVNSTIRRCSSAFAKPC